MQILLSLSVALLAGLGLTRLVRLFKLPDVTAYLVAGIFVGAICLNLIDRLVPHLHKLVGPDIENHNNANLSKVLLFVTAIAIHNLPEGIAAGVGFGSGDVSQALIIAGGIALQNIPPYSSDGRISPSTAAASMTPAAKDSTISENLWDNFLNINPMTEPMTVAPPTPSAVISTSSI